MRNIDYLLLAVFVEPRVEPQKSIWQRYCRCFSCGASNAKVDYTTRPLDRQDIFFGGSVADLERIASRSMDTRPLSRPHVATSRHVGFKIERTCKICPASLGQMLVKMLDIRLFKSPTFCVLLLALFMWMLGLYIPYNYVVGEIVRSPLLLQPNINSDTPLSIRRSRLIPWDRFGNQQSALANRLVGQHHRTHSGRPQLVHTTTERHLSGGNMQRCGRHANRCLGVADARPFGRSVCVRHRVWHLCV